MSERERLMKNLQIADFALIDTVLYLDTHPSDKAALNYYDRLKQIRQTRADEYISKFGPLNNTNVESSDMFSWVDNPWPWEVDA